MTSEAPHIFQLQTLADWCATLVDAPTPESAKRVRDAALDWWGALAVGMQHPLASKYKTALLGESTGPLRVAGSSRSASVIDATMTNAALSHLAEVDDGHRLAMMHPGITVFPVVMSLAQTLDLEASDIRASIIAGYEVGLRIGALLGKEHYAVCHNTATAGTFGAAAVASRAMRLSPQQTLWTLGHAGTQAAGLWQFLDDDAEAAKAFHAATAVRNGLTAARLAAANIPAATDVLGGPRGLLKAYNLEGEAKHLEDIGSSPLQIETVTIKSWPTCGQMHSSLDALRDILHETPFSTDQIQTVMIHAPKAQMDIAARTSPKTFEEAKFSTAFCAAFLLTEHDLNFTNFTAAALDRTTLHELASRVAVEEDPTLTQRFPKERPTRVEISLKDGRVLTKERSFRRGDPEAPWSFEELKKRFSSIAPSLSALTQDAIVTWAATLPDTQDRQTANLKDLFARLCPSQGETL